MDVNQQEPAEKAPESVNIAELLVTAREKMQLSAEDIALQMNLTVSVINKIELNQFEQDIPLAFIRGYVRSYAQIVGLDVASICAEFDTQTSQEEKPIEKMKVVSNFNMSRKEVNSNSLMFKSVTLLIVISLMGLAGWEAWKRFTPSSEEAEVNTIQLDTQTNDEKIEVSMANEVSDSSPVAPQTVLVRSEEISNDSAVANTATIDTSELNPSSAVQATEINQSDTSATDNEIVNQTDNTGAEGSAVTDNAITELESVQTQVAEVTQENTQDEFSSQATLVSADFVFSGDCWVQVKDANENILAIGVKRAGKIMNLQGVAPLSVILGEPSVVKLTYQGENYELSQYRPGRTAQFKLE